MRRFGPVVMERMEHRSEHRVKLKQTDSPKTAEIPVGPEPAAPLFSLTRETRACQQILPKRQRRRGRNLRESASCQRVNVSIKKRRGDNRTVFCVSVSSLPFHAFLCISTFSLIPGLISARTLNFSAPVFGLSLCIILFSWLLFEMFAVSSTASLELRLRLSNFPQTNPTTQSGL